MRKIVRTRQVRYGYPTKMGLTDSCVSLPQAKLSEFTSFIQIRFGNPHTIGEFIGLMTLRHAHVQSTFSYVAPVTFGIRRVGFF